MSTPPRPPLGRSLAIVWRTLRSMRTALILLLLLALGSVAGSLIPQEPNSPERVARFLAEHELLGAFYRRAGLFDVFGSWGMFFAPAKTPIADAPTNAGKAASWLKKIATTNGNSIVALKTVMTAASTLAIGSTVSARPLRLAIVSNEP